MEGSVEVRGEWGDLAQKEVVLAIKVISTEEIGWRTIFWFCMQIFGFAYMSNLSNECQQVL